MSINLKEINLRTNLRIFIIENWKYIIKLPLN